MLLVWDSVGRAGIAISSVSPLKQIAFIIVIINIFFSYANGLMVFMFNHSKVLGGGTPNRSRSKHNVFVVI